MTRYYADNEDAGDLETTNEADASAESSHATAAPRRRRGQRTDPHRPGAIVPADYEQVLSYSLATTSGGWPIPSIGVDCALERRLVTKAPDGSVRVEDGAHSTSGRCCVFGALAAGGRLASTGGLGKCSVCGAVYTYGDLWRHVPTGELVHLGHDCVDKYSMLADRSEWELEDGRVRARAAAARLKEQNQAERVEFLAAHPGLGEAFALADARREAIEAQGPNRPAGQMSNGLSILCDLAARFQGRRSLSEAQVALALKLAAELAAPRPPERHVPAPEGRTVVEGVLVSRKVHEGAYGTSVKVTIKVETPDGSWLAWGTAPARLLDADPKRGDRVRLVATLKRGRDEHFALFKRPTGGEVVERAPGAEGVRQ